MATWVTRHISAEANGCDLSVLRRAEGEWLWIVKRGEDRVADGAAATMADAMKAAEAEAGKAGR